MFQFESYLIRIAYCCVPYHSCHIILFQFFELIGNDARATSQCKNEITIFSPSDDALKAFKRPVDHNIIMNSMGNFLLLILHCKLIILSRIIFGFININFPMIVNTAFDVSNILKLGRRGSKTVTARLASMSQGSPPLWLTRMNNDFYLNGAKFVFRNMGVSCSIFISCMRI